MSCACWAVQMGRMNALLDKELWSAVDAPPQAQKLVAFFEGESVENRGGGSSDSLVNGNASADSKAAGAPSSKAEGEQPGAGVGSSPAKGQGKGEGEGAAEGASPGAKKAVKTLLCHGDSYHVCNRCGMAHTPHHSWLSVLMSFTLTTSHDLFSPSPPLYLTCIGGVPLCTSRFLMHLFSKQGQGFFLKKRKSP